MFSRLSELGIVVRILVGHRIPTDPYGSQYAGVRARIPPSCWHLPETGQSGEDQRRRAVLQRTNCQLGPVPNFGGDPTLPGRFTNQVVRDQATTSFLQSGNRALREHAINLRGLRGLESGLYVALDKKFVLAEVNV